MDNIDDIKTFVLAGKATFTLRSDKTGVHHTYSVRAPVTPEGQLDYDANARFVQVLVGPDNTSDYQFLGTIFDGKRYFHGKKSRIKSDASSAVAFTFLWRCLDAGHMPSAIRFQHAGKCARCGRVLTTPESIDTGIGPVCAGKV